MVRIVATLVAFFLVAGPVPAQDNPEGKDKPEENPEGGPLEKDRGRPAHFEFLPYFDLVEATYVPPEKESGQQAIQLKFDISTDVPKGCKLRLSIDLNGLPVEESEYVLKDENRKGLAFTWKPKKRLATGEYRLRTHIDLENQVPGVQRIIKQNPKRFPPNSVPWSSYLKGPILVGSAEDEAREAEVLCAAYTALLDKLVENYDELKEKVKSVKEGKELVTGEALDAVKFEAYVKEWREKQGAAQKDILLFAASEPVLVQKSGTAFLQLQALGRMVSKYSVQLQGEVTTQYKVPAINPAVKDFDRNSKYKPDPDKLQTSYKNILKLVGCPDEEEEGAEKPAEPGAGDTAGADGKAAGDGETQEPAPAENPEKGAEKGTEKGTEKGSKKASEKTGGKKAK